jgi:DNA-binding transcriptional regulator YiaG
MTTFREIMQKCGLSIQGAAYYLSVSPHTVKSWLAGRRNPREGVFTEMETLKRFVENNRKEKL